MRILLFDNYDSFTYNLLHLLRELGADAEVHRNDRITLEEAGRFDKIILSPGPGIPEEAGILLPLIERYAPERSIFGVCLGMQAIGQAFGAGLENLPEVFHGIQTSVRQCGADPLFEGLEEEFPVGRYHSWVVKRENLPPELRVTAEDAQGRIMALRHTCYDVQGVQFHPESILTPQGSIILQNFLKR